ncbi:hypothetical protein ACFQ46_02285 [Kineococcus sp. GCM10028916]|uniref:hypothetical protein n=1 Tax=Kineococcus sp. GCM10028916 TaxID=3273394 RepID=UPI00364589E4
MNEDTAPGTDLGTVTKLPLPDALEALLRSLQPVRITRHHRRPSRLPLRQTGQWLDADLPSRRLGFTMPVLPSLRERGQLEVVGPDPRPQLR